MSPPTTIVSRPSQFCRHESTCDVKPSSLLKSQGIGLMSLEERIDTTSTAGELLFHVFGAIVHFERRLIGERTRDEIEAAMARGTKLGRPIPQVDVSLAGTAGIESARDF